MIYTFYPNFFLMYLPLLFKPVFDRCHRPATTVSIVCCKSYPEFQDGIFVRNLFLPLQNLFYYGSHTYNTTKNSDFEVL